MTPHLPEELLLLILEQLTPLEHGWWEEPKCSHRTTLAAACLVNKQCLRLARPILHRRMQPRRGEDILRISKALALSARNVSDLVHELHIDDWHFQPDSELDDVMENDEAHHVPESMRPRFSEALDFLRPTMHPVGGPPLLDALMEGSEDAHLAFCLMQCANLEVLSITVPHAFNESWVSAVLMHAVAMSQAVKNPGPKEVESSKLHLQHLKELSTQHWDTEYATSITDLSDILLIKSLKKFHGFAVDVTGEQNPLKTQPYALESIKLQYSLFDAEGLRRLLSCCSNLKTLSIEVGPATVGDCDIKWNDVGQDLRQHGQSLKRLEFDLSQLDYMYESEETIWPPLGDLTPLSALECLIVPAWALFGLDDDMDDNHPNFEMPELASILPQSLKELRLSEWEHLDDTWLEAAQENLKRMLAAHGKLGNLKTVKILGSDMLSDDFKNLKRWRVDFQNSFQIVLRKHTGDDS